MMKTIVLAGLVIGLSSLASLFSMDRHVSAFSDLPGECTALYSAPGNPWGENGIVQEPKITPSGGQTGYIKNSKGDVGLNLAINVGFCKDHSIRDPAIWSGGCGIAPTACYQTPNGTWYGTYYPKTVERYFQLYGGMRYAGGAIVPISLSVPSLASGPYQVEEPYKNQGDRVQSSGAYVPATINVPDFFDTSRQLEFCVKSGYADSVNYYNQAQQLSYSFFEDNNYMCTPISITHNYDLQPTVSVDPPSGVIEAGSEVTATGNVSNTGGESRPTDWWLTKIVVPAGSGGIPPRSGGTSSQAPCDYWPRSQCSWANSSSAGVQTFGAGYNGTPAGATDTQTFDLAPGTQICYAMSVRPYDQTTGDWRHSTPKCVTIGKKPKIQIWGGDLTVGRRFNDDVNTPSASSVDVSTSTKDNSTKTFGSWIEYGIFAPGPITGGSAAGLAGPTGNASSAQSDWSKLTFANGGQTADSGCTTTGFGCYAKPGAMGIIPDVVSRLAPGKVTDAPQLPNGALDSLSGTYYATSDAIITGGTITKGKSVVIRAAGTVHITGDIRYTSDTLTSINDIPQVVIIANNIVIDDNVSNVDAWLIANGTSGGIYTCGDLKAILTSKICDKQLTVNGPVMSKKLFLQRTAGSGTGAASGDPAEVLNLRADAYLWAISHSGGAGGIQTLDTHELAPRF